MPKQSIKAPSCVNPTEEWEQRELFSRLNQLCQIWPKFNLIFHIPNSGAGPSRGMAGRMKAMGAKPGVSDIFYPVARQGYHGMWLELKSRKPNARLTRDQRLWLVSMRYEGYYSVFCHGCMEALQAIISYETGVDLPEQIIDRLPEYQIRYGNGKIKELILHNGQKQK